MKSFKTYLESVVDLENKVRDYLMKGGRGKTRSEVTGVSLRNNMKKYDKYNELEDLIKELITDGEIEFKLNGKKKVTRMKDFYKQQYKLTKPFGRADNDFQQSNLDKKKDKAKEKGRLTIFTQKNTFKWIGR